MGAFGGTGGPTSGITDSTGTASSVGDPNFNKVVLLLEGDSFTDVSINRSQIVNDGIAISNIYPGIIADSFIYSPGLVGQPLYATVASTAAIAANQDLTIELSAYCVPNRLGSALYSNRTPGGSANGILIGLDPRGRAFVRVTSGGTLVVEINTYFPLTLNALHSLCLERASGVWTLFINGIPFVDQKHNNLWAGAVDSGPYVYIGGDPYTNPFIGGIGQIRLTMGVARYATAYGISLTSFPVYSTSPNITFGSLSNNISKIGTTYIANVVLTNTATATIRAVNGSGSTVGSNWTIVAANNGVPNSWIISGNPPTNAGAYNLVITATTPQSLGSLSATQTFSIYNTVTGSLSAEQSFLYGVPELSLWLDASDSTTLNYNSGTNAVVQFIDKAASVPFLPSSGRVPPTVSSGVLSLPTISFSNNAASGLQTTNPVVVTDGSSNSTIFLVGKYNGQQLGQGAGVFQLAYLPDTSIVDGTATWGMVTSAVGTAAASVLLYDNSAIQDGAISAPIVSSGSSFLIVWKSTTGLAQVYVNQQLIAVSAEPNTGNGWSAINAAIGFIGGAQVPNGAFVSIGEIVAFSSDLSSSVEEQVESYLNHKWSIYPFVPFAQTPSVLAGYVGNQYYATTIITDATSVSISASAGSNWTITPANSDVAGQYVITGTLPSISETVALTITTNNASATGTDVYGIIVSPQPTTPVIGTPSNLNCQEGTSYLGLIYIESCDSATVTANAGSNWTIYSAPSGVDGNYVITGSMPARV